MKNQKKGHTDYEILKEELEYIPRNYTYVPNVYSIWKHYKGEKYIVLGFNIRESNETVEVRYNSVEKPLPIPWTRPLGEWNEIIKDVNGKDVRRFTLLK